MVSDLEGSRGAELVPRPVRPDFDPVAVYLGSLGPGSRQTMWHALQKIARLATGGGSDDPHAFPWEKLRPHHTAALRVELEAAYAPATVNKLLSAIRGVLKACWRIELMDSDTYQRTADVQSVRGTRLPAGRHVTQGELSAIYRVLAEDPSPAARRDAAMIACLFGCRRAEVAAIDMSNVELIEHRLRVPGKGNKERYHYLGRNGGTAAVRAWLKVRGDEDGPLFCPVNKGGVIEIRRISVVAIHKVVQKRRERACVPPFSCHDLRRSFISEALDAGIDLSTVQGLVGHANVQTTVRYDRRPERVKAAAVERLHVPYVAPHE